MHKMDRVLDCCEVARKSEIVVLHESNWAIEFYDSGEYYYFPINFCPWCGNPLSIDIGETNGV